MSGRLALVVVLLAGCSESTPQLVSTPAARDWRDEVIYQIVVDRFADGDPGNNRQDGVGTTEGDLARHQGGDYRGIVDHLDYLENLGVTALWLSPIVDNVPQSGAQDGYHGYWARDFTKVNARFGSEAELIALVAEAHARGMRVILDVVINHAGNVFFYDLDGDGEADPGEREPPFSTTPYVAPLVRTQAPVRLWREDAAGALETWDLPDEAFHRHGQTVVFSDATQLERGDFPTGLRDLATDDDEVMAALITTYAEWARRTDVDGFRLDAVPHVSRDDWRRFCEGLRARLHAMGKREFMLLGEVFRSSPADLAPYTAQGLLDSVFDFTFKTDAVDTYLLAGGPASLARAALEGARAFYPSSPQPGGLAIDPFRARVTFVDNHDVPRIAGKLEDRRAVWLSLLLMFTVDGNPAVYYGTEQGFTGGFGDASREVLWNEGFDETHPSYAFLQTLVALRSSHRVLRRGDLTVRYASLNDGQSDAEDAGIFAFERSDEQARMLVVLNGHAQKASRASIPTGFTEGTFLVDVLGDFESLRIGVDGAVNLSLNARTARVLVAE